MISKSMNILLLLAFANYVATFNFTFPIGIAPIGPKLNITGWPKDLQDLLNGRPIWQKGQRPFSMVSSFSSNGAIKGRNVLNKNNCNCVSVAKSRIVGGRTSTVSYPWMVQLDLGGGSCGGVIINSRQVITAAHCTEGTLPRQIVVFAGTNDMSRMTSANAYRVQFIDDSPLYARNGGNIARPGDFSVLTIEESKPFDFNNPNIKPACLEYQYRDNYGPLLSTGWGVTEPSIFYQQSGQPANNPRSPNSLKEAVFAYIPTSRASETTDPTNCRAGHLVCIKEINSGDGTCHGDSGGPIHAYNSGRLAVIGVTSFGPAQYITYNGYPAYKFCYGPSMYSRLTYYVNFLESTTGSHNICWI